MSGLHYTATFITNVKWVKKSALTDFAVVENSEEGEQIDQSPPSHSAHLQYRLAFICVVSPILHDTSSYTISRFQEISYHKRKPPAHF